MTDPTRISDDQHNNAPAHEKHWTENEPVRLPSARTDRVYLAGPMTGISELNFPAFNQEAERLRAEGLQVLNPADHGIVDGADWADYLRHDIAGLASCERIHLLRGWTKSKGACLEMTIAKALGMTVTYQVDAEMEHNNAPAVPQGWKLVPVEPTRAMWAAVNKLDDEMAAGSYDGKGCSIEQAWNCMLDFAPDAPALAATQAPAPAQEPYDKAMLDVIDERERCREWADQLADAIAKHTGYEIGEHTSANNPWRMALNALVCHEAKPAQEAGLTDEQKTWAVNQLMEQAQVFASAWSLVGGRHDFGNALEEAEQAKTELRSMVVEALRAKGGKL